jgi:CheY-like chemotaxis protein
VEEGTKKTKRKARKPITREDRLYLLAVLGAERSTPCVLVVEDRPDFAMLYERLLRDAGFHVQLAAGGEEGLAKVRSHRPELVLMDRRMPLMHGIEALDEIQKDPLVAGTRVVIHAVTLDPDSGPRESAKLVSAVRRALAT